MTLQVYSGVGVFGFSISYLADFSGCLFQKTFFGLLFSADIVFCGSFIVLSFGDKLWHSCALQGHLEVVSAFLSVLAVYLPVFNAQIAVLSVVVQESDIANGEKEKQRK